VFAPTHDRREFLKRGGAAVAGASLLGLSGCGAGSGSGGLTLGISADLVPVVRDQLRRFARSAGGAEVTIRLFPADTDQYFDRVRTQLQAGSDDLDVFAGDVTWPAQLGANGWLADLNGRFATSEQAAFLPATIAANRYEGKTLGVPLFVDLGLLYYRKDLLEQSGFTRPPATWDELREMAEKVMRDQRVKHGFVFTGAVYEGGTLLGLEFIRSTGDVLIDGTEIVATDAQIVQGLEIERSMVTSGISPQAVANFQEDQAAGAFLAGDAVFLRNWSYTYGLVSDPEQSKLQPDQVGIAAVPVADPGVEPANYGGNWNLFMNAASTKQDAAWRLMEALTTREQELHRVVDGGYLPTRKALYDDATLLRRLPSVAATKREIAQMITPPVSPYYKDMSAVMATEFNACLRGVSSPEETAKTLQERLRAILEQAD
jgi:multiple sugar transport system substrate-binding protein